MGERKFSSAARGRILKCGDPAIDTQEEQAHANHEPSGRRDDDGRVEFSDQRASDHRADGAAASERQIENAHHAPPHLIGGHQLNQRTDHCEDRQQRHSRQKDHRAGKRNGRRESKRCGENAQHTEADQRISTLMFSFAQSGN